MAVEKLPIVTVIEHYGGHVPGTRHGWQKLRCIFHDESNPSASVNMDEGLFRCFGCEIESPIGTTGVKTLDGLDIVAIKEGCNDFACAVECATNIFGEFDRDISGSAKDSRQRNRVFGESRPKRGQRNAFSSRVRGRTFGGT